MDADALKGLQAPLKEKYRSEPAAARITLRAEGRLGDNVSCSIETGRAIAAAGLHPASGGDGTLACSGDMLLQALAACAGVTLNAVATAIGVQLGEAQVIAEGDLDFRGTLGVDKLAPVGFSDIRLCFIIGGDISDEERATLLKLTERYCVVLQTLKTPASISAEMVRLKRYV
ncbi:MAG: OsmC family protein [Caulobacteraceae bacterium]